MDKKVEATLVFDGDSKRFHRFRVQHNEITGTVYVPKSADGIPETIILKCKPKEMKKDG